MIFDELKKRFTETPILAVFDPETLIMLETDVFDYTLKAYLIQSEQDGKPHSVAF